MNIFRHMMVKAALAPIYFYRYCVSPLIPPRCRFVPTCSDYAAEAITIHGPLKGSWLAFRRILKCHPFSRCHGHDPVPRDSGVKAKSSLAQKGECCKNNITAKH